ncbi:FMN-binding negative transcriptional regulator [Dactylosporangium sp. AC04546]|uniref:FMN-binding negative transcriptional regulator n=1 Tax=Dactylosporangium sp. AC04546 TaxID=2862460 RepID=UPI001EDF3B0A|nr:FMN-binding negative transcriptional regulator [Dactylosporangium sp. AC04546]WVK81950.1 FMN-binding negative transcriptional regulator [Dactylosporangium sp. AC04546]
MLVHPWDAAATDEEWRGFLRERDFGQLVAPGRGRDLPVVVPTHFTFDGAATVWLHLARPNPVWPLLEEHPRALLSVIGDYVYVPSDWNANPGTDVTRGVPTSYYAAVQLACDVRIVDDRAEKAALLRRQLGHFQPDVEREPVTETDRELPGIRGIELTVTSVTAKFKFGGNKTPGHRQELAARLAGRGGPLDAAARAHLLRRIDPADS